MTTQMGAVKSPGNWDASVRNASTPPADVPITTSRVMPINGGTVQLPRRDRPGHASRKLRYIAAMIRTTHVGSLPGPIGFDPTAPHTDDDLRLSVQWIVDLQRTTNLDIINEGELTKGGDWLAFMDRRLGGFDERPAPTAGSIISTGKDREAFADFYRYASERQSLFFVPDKRMSTQRRYLACTSPITYTGTAALNRELSMFRSVVGDSH